MMLKKSKYVIGKTYKSMHLMQEARLQTETLNLNCDIDFTMNQWNETQAFVIVVIIIITEQRKK